MGRGSSGRTSARVSRPQRQQQPRTPQQPERRRRTPQEWLNHFDSADDTQATAALNEWRQERMDADNRSNNTDIQRFFHNIGWSENTPVVLDEQQYQAARRAAGNPQQLYHSDKPAGGTTPQQFADQFFGRGRDASGNAYRQYMSGGYFGGGTYFATSARGSAGYGTNQFRGFLNQNARVIDFNRLQSDYDRYTRAHPAFARMMRNVKDDYGGEGEKLSIFAAMRGYNVIHNGISYYTVLDRRAITVSTRQMRTSRRMADW